MADKRTAAQQARDFRNLAREAETDDDPAAFERVFAKIVPPKTGKPSPKPSGKRK